MTRDKDFDLLDALNTTILIYFNFKYSQTRKPAKWSQDMYEIL